MSRATPDRSRLARWWPLLLAVVLAALYASMQWQRLGQIDGPRHKAVGTRLEGIELTPLTEGAQVVTDADLRGKVVLLNFWGTWCPPCRIEMPHLVELYSRHSGQSAFVMLPVSCLAGKVATDPEELRPATQSYLESLNADLPAYADLNGVTRLRLIDTAELGETFSYPTTVVLDTQGVIRGIWIGYSPGIEDDMDRTVRALLPY